MSLHYHGLPLTPFEMLDRLKGKHVCISFATARKKEVAWALKHAQSIMWDNGAFSAFTQGVTLDVQKFYRWVEPNLMHPHWAVVPDVINGTSKEQKKLLKGWPFDRALGAPVWHLGLPLHYLLYLADEWPRICLGSSDRYWKVGGMEWARRMDKAFDFLSSRRNTMPWIHGLRMLSQLGKRWPLASADSVNVARNFKSGWGKCPGCMSNKIDEVNNSVIWTPAVFRL